MKEKMTFYCLELSKMVKERKNLVGPTSKSLPLTYGRKGRDTSIFWLKVNNTLTFIGFLFPLLVKCFFFFFLFLINRFVILICSPGLTIALYSHLGIHFFLVEICKHVFIIYMIIYVCITISIQGYLCQLQNVDLSFLSLSNPLSRIPTTITIPSFSIYFLSLHNLS